MVCAVMTMRILLTLLTSSTHSGMCRLQQTGSQSPQLMYACICASDPVLTYTGSELTFVTALKILQNTAYPGETFELGLETLDEIGKRTSAVIRISDRDDSVSFSGNTIIFLVILLFTLLDFTGGIYL